LKAEGPISPSEILGYKQNDIPSFVYEAFNTLIVRNWNGTSATVKQKDVIALLPEEKQAEAYANHWLDVEDIYRHAGWGVKYDKPAYNETYDAHFVFSKRRKR
jgi:hypothetical protein